MSGLGKNILIWMLTHVFNFHIWYFTKVNFHYTYNTPLMCTFESLSIKQNFDYKSFFLLFSEFGVRAEWMGVGLLYTLWILCICEYTSSNNKPFTCICNLLNSVKSLYSFMKSEIFLSDWIFQRLEDLRSWFLSRCITILISQLNSAISLGKLSIQFVFFLTLCLFDFFVL